MSLKYLVVAENKEVIKNADISEKHMCDTVTHIKFSAL